MNSMLETLAGGAGWDQNARLLRLTTPAGANALLAESARIVEALGPQPEHAGFRIDLTVLSSNAHQSLTALLGQPARLDLQTSGLRQFPRPFHGHITEIVRLGANGGFARYRLVIEPWLAFLGHRRDSYLFQERSVIEIIDELLGDWKSQGKLAPEWRWDLADVAAYPKRGLTVQYQETDLDFLKRLLAEEGLFCWFEHKTGEGETLGSHSLVIADHNSAFKDNAQSTFRFTQPGATLAEDSVDRWHGLRQLDTTELNAVSWDCRSLSARPQSAVSLAGQDVNLIAQGNHSLAVKSGLVLFTVGKAGNKSKPNQHRKDEGAHALAFCQRLLPIHVFQEGKDQRHVSNDWKLDAMIEAMKARGMIR